ncbi:alpha-L-fucosidase [Paenibacillus kandeliae]|uniref:alpha-L-fucosidase n=1 Tax=Paenibacillus kandeliae TaxID=3231269 RepID=UPI0034578F7F
MSISIREAATVTPSARQLAWQKLEFYGFIHFTVNTFTDREWGDGTESPDIFHPTELDARQWAQACHAAGMKGLILTCKHHDGFCLWPSRYTEHSVRNSPWRQRQGDLVREVSEACHKYGLKFGIYLSPWDRHERSYGDSEAYNDYFVHQLEELLTEYGDIFSVWFDGACGEGPNGKRQIYDWDRYYAVIRRHQPQAVISVCGPDVRWCGNEAGHTRTSEWCVVPASMQDNEKIQEKSQTEDDATFASRINSDEDDLGSREVIAKADKLIWYPAEVNTSIRPGWFYHATEDDLVKDTDTLMELYERTVGGNSCFLLNLPPDRRGLIHEKDVQVLQELGERIAVYDDNDLAFHAAVQVTECADAQPMLFDGSCLTDGREDTWWQSAEGVEQAMIELDLGQTVTFDRVVLREHIASGQRIEQFTVEVLTASGEWQVIHMGTVVGYKCICRLAPQQARYMRISIVGSRWCPTLQSVGVFDTAQKRNSL